MLLILTLYPKGAVYHVDKKQYFKARLANVKLAALNLCVKENLSDNIVVLSSKTLYNLLNWHLWLFP